jgi:GNAT superfamily N-acetyltransferase
VTSDDVFDVHPAGPDRWPDLEAVMGSRGDAARCWCQFFQLRGAAWGASSAAANRDRLRRQISDSDRPPGVLAYHADEPVGWCAVGPKPSYPRLAASPVAGSETAGIWSVTCFVVRVGWRRRGVAGALLAGAVELARAGGATSVEAYPVDPMARSSVSAAELYHGPLPVFLDAGFRDVARPSAGRARVRLEV